MSALPEFGPLCVPFFAAPDLSSADAQAMKDKYIGDDTSMYCMIPVANNLCKKFMRICLGSQVISFRTSLSSCKHSQIQISTQFVHGPASLSDAS